MRLKFLLPTVALIMLGVTMQAHASAELVKEKNCMVCHSVDKKLVGPSFNDIKQKYEKNPSALTKLSDKIRKGGSGVWGAVPMPPNTQVSEDDAKVLVRWILGQ